MAIRVKAPGLSTTVQDLGRPGYYHLGIPLSGAMDRLALAAANLLVGNDEGAAGLEIVFLGPELEFTADATVAVTGATMTPKVNGEARDNWASFAVKKGDVLSFDFLKAGARAYLAVSGGIDVPVVLGSRSTYPLGALGGLQGQAAPGRRRTAGRRRRRQGGRPHGPGESPPHAGQAGGASRRSRPLLVPDHRAVRPRFLRRHLEGGAGGRPHRLPLPRRAAAASSCRGQQPFGAGSDPSNIVDACYPYGSIQVPGGTEPIVLHRDAVSGGGYMMVGTVISADMDLIGQLQPHTETRFVPVDMAGALKARHDREALLGKVRARRSPDAPGGAGSAPSGLDVGRYPLDDVAHHLLLASIGEEVVVMALVELERLVL